MTDDLDANTCELTNDGTLTIGDQFKLNGYSSVFENFDNVLVADNSTLNGTINNYAGTIHFDKELEINGGATFNNTCKLWADELLYVEGTLNNYGYVQADATFNLNGGATLVMDEGSLLSCDDMDLESIITGPTSGYAKIEVADYSNLHWGTAITGKIDFCDADGTIESNHASMSGDVTYCVNEVPATDCVPGNGSNPNDQDNDGVPDSLDEYPTDPLRAFNSYYPNASDYSSFAFEDLWPSTGDYDFNDLVVNFQYQLVTNANNNVVELISNFKFEAAGASYNNGFGFAFDALPNTVDSVKGTQLEGSIISLAANGLEAGHTNQSVVIVCDAINTYAGTGMFNTSSGGSTVDVPLITVTVTFLTPQASIGTEPYNPFIFIDGTRGREVHMINYEPTELVNQALLGTVEDISNPANSIYYKTINNYPFAIETPVLFDYPTEKDDIVTAHLKFGNWAESGGINYQDWYENNTGYRTLTKVLTNNN